MGLSLLAFLPPWKTLSLMHREDRWIWERLRVLMSCGGSERAGSGVVGRGRAGQRGGSFVESLSIHRRGCEDWVGLLLWLISDSS